MTMRVSPPVRAALLGYGFAGRTFHAPLLRTTPGLVIQAVASRQAEQVRADLGAHVAVDADPLAVVARPDVDLVVIATPNHTHAPLATAALQAGKAVVVDKPFALTTAEAADVVALAAARQQLLSVFHNRRWDGDFLTVAGLLASGQLGRITHAVMHFDRFRAQVRARWREAAGPGGGLYIDLMPHLVDQAVQLFGWPTGIQGDIAAQRDGAQADDFAHLQLRYARRLRVDLHASALAAFAGPRFVLHGTRGGYRKWGLDAQEDHLKAGLLPDPAHPQAWGVDPNPGELLLADDPQQPDALRAQTWPTLPGRYPDYYAAVVATLTGDAPNPVPATEALGVMQLMDLGRQSAALQQALPVGPRP
ncbi:oxidoreductase [Ideonella sp. LYT19W]|uniref:Oxidoreductase n=2 Tax=Ideonella margarita TaxID=2984191 RepID=A0ABU9C801_9BURK